MTNEEIKKKIVDVAISQVWTDSFGDEIVIDRKVAMAFADALIEANIFVDIDTLKDEQQSMNGILTNMSSYMNYKLHELEHRAEVAEKALLMACANAVKDEKDDVNIELLVRVLYDRYLKQAEKELAEEAR